MKMKLSELIKDLSVRDAEEKRTEWPRSIRLRERKLGRMDEHFDMLMSCARIARDIAAADYSQCPYCGVDIQAEKKDGRLKGNTSKLAELACHAEECYWREAKEMEL